MFCYKGCYFGLFFFFKQKTAYEFSACLVGSEMCIRDRLTEIALLREKLVAGLPEERELWTNEQRACWLLAQLLEWHRREEKSMWWEYYRLCELSDEELIEDKNALGGLEYVGVVGERKKSLIHRYQFPFQDFTIDRALDVHDPRTQDSVGTIENIDELNLTIDIKRGKTSEKPHPTALIPHDYVSSKKQVESLMRIARWEIEKGVEQQLRGSGGALGADRERDQMGR